MRAIAIGLVCLGLAACDTPNFRTSQFQFGESKTLAATGNLRFVSERHRQLPHGVTTVVCSEPSPDYATASGTDASGTVKSTSTTSPISEGSLTLKTTEQIIQLEGRSKGVLALRDGLYAACQAYANGIIGKDAYSMVLSQYGLLLVSLMRDDTFAKENAQARQASQTPAASAFAAVLVSCINNYDPTRRDYLEASSNRFHSNRLLGFRHCQEILRRAGSGRLG